METTESRPTVIVVAGSEDIREPVQLHLTPLGTYCQSLAVVHGNLEVRHVNDIRNRWIQSSRYIQLPNFA